MDTFIGGEFARYPIQDWVIWLGAGVSVGGPTRLPAGAPLTWFTVRETCGAAVEERMKQLWERMNALAATRDTKEPLGQLPRLETILGEVAVAEAASTGAGFQFMRGFRSFADAPFNRNHALAAGLLAAGATIITPNFDFCIQHAYSRLPRVAPLSMERVGNAFRFAKRDGAPGEIWHIHGIADDVASLGTTVSMVKEGLPREFEEMLRRRVRGGVAIAFFGYSASDSFDVTPFFTQLTHGEARSSCAAFVQHPGNPVPESARRILKPFETNTVCVLDTTETLHELAARAGCVGPAAATGAFDWSEAFLRAADLTRLPASRDFLVCRVANVLGVNVNLLDPAALPGAEASAARFEPVEYHKTMAVAYRPMHNPGKEREHDEAVKREATDMLGYFFAHGKLKEARALAMPVSQLLADRADHDELDWRAYTSMSVHCRIELNARLKPMASLPRGSRRAHAEKLAEVARKLGGRPYRGVRFINQIATARRFSFLFDALLNGHENTAEAGEVLRLYGDAASVAGFVSAYRDIAVARFFLARYHRKPRMYVPALTAARKSLRLAQAAGDTVGARRATLLLARIGAFPA